MTSLWKSSTRFVKPLPTCAVRQPLTTSIGLRLRRTISIRLTLSAAGSSGAMRSFWSMPKPALRIGVLTLCPGDETQLNPGPLGDQVKTLIGGRFLNYTPAPDDWVPFNDGTPILQHLKNGLDRFELFSDSSSLADFAARRGIKLFVIDPLVLLHPAKASLAVLIQEHVCSRSDKASCIVIRDSLPAQFLSDFCTFYLDIFRDLMDNANSV